MIAYSFIKDRIALLEECMNLPDSNYLRGRKLYSHEALICSTFHETLRLVHVSMKEIEYL